MGKIECWHYDNCSDYPKKNNLKQTSTIILSEWEIVKYSILNALFNGHPLSKEGKNFYSSFYKVAIKEDNQGRYICTTDYKCAESSYKVTISFALGMIATRIIALKKYDIIHLFHLKDKSIEYSPKGTNVPDWFGIDSHGKPFLFESKGSDNSSASRERVENAKKQLMSIRSVTDKSGSIKVFSASTFKKHVIVSCFRYDKKNNVRDRWYIQDIDPIGEGTIDIIVNLDKECYKYYSAFVSFLDSYNVHYEEREINQQRFYFLITENEKFGIHKSIYEAVKSSRYTEDNEFRNFNKYINEVLNAIECEKYIEDSSSFEDGLIICSKDKTFS